MKRILALLLLVCSLCALTACNDDGTGISGIKGEWEFSNMTQTYGEDSQSIRVGDDMNGVTIGPDLMTLTINKDGTGTATSKMDGEGSEESLTWEETDSGYEVVIDGQKYKASLSGSSLHLSASEGENSIWIVFTKKAKEK